MGARPEKTPPNHAAVSYRRNGVWPRVVAYGHKQSGARQTKRTRGLARQAMALEFLCCSHIARRRPIALDDAMAHLLYPFRDAFAYALTAMCMCTGVLLLAIPSFSLEIDFHSALSSKGTMTVEGMRETHTHKPLGRSTRDTSALARAAS